MGITTSRMEQTHFDGSLDTGTEHAAYGFVIGSNTGKLMSTGGRPVQLDQSTGKK